MSMFTPAISCLTISNLLLFMDLTFQVPMQYCSLQHRTLLLPPDICTTEHHFCFGTITLFFFELLVIALWSSPVAYWTPSKWGAHLLVSHLFDFHAVHGVLAARILEWLAIPSSREPHFVRILHYDLSILGDPACHGSELHWVMQAPLSWQGCHPWRGLGH